MSDSAANSEFSRWSELLRRALDPVFILNHQRRVVYANPAWELVARTSLHDARNLTCTTRDTGHPLAPLGVAMTPPPDVLNGRAITVRRPLPNCDTGPQWWDIDFLPLMGESELVAIVGRIRPVRMSPKSTLKIPKHLAELRHRMQLQFNLSRWDSADLQTRKVVAQAQLVANTGSAASLVGETGTGKKTLARTIHALSSRREMPCVCLACDRLPAESVRAALENPIGLAYLESPATLPRDMQAELARSLFQKTQVVLGFHIDPTIDMRNGRLAESLWSAASTIVISLPPLRERFNELPSLVQAILQRLVTEGPAPTLTPAAMEVLGNQFWPGNLDELAGILRTATTRSQLPIIDVGDLPLALREPVEVNPPSRTWLPLDQLLEKVEARMMQLALERAKGNKTKAAELLGVWRPRLIRRLAALESPGEGDE